MEKLSEDNKQKLGRFLRWLKELQLYTLWLHNFKGWIGPTGIQIQPENLVAYSFCWSDTQEGLEFWVYVSVKWIQYNDVEINYPKLTNTVMKDILMREPKLRKYFPNDYIKTQ